jgi:hypothetical protein
MRFVAALVLVTSLAAGPAWAQAAQQAQPQPPQPEKTQPPPDVETVTINPNLLGVSISRIQKRLFTQETLEQSGLSPLHLEFQVQVFGSAPKIDVLKGVDLFNGPVPGTAPSHQQMIDFWTPQAYSAPALPVSAIAFFLAQQIWKKSQKTACEEEIAAYRSLLMQGVNVAAPRCANK